MTLDFLVCLQDCQSVYAYCQVMHILSAIMLQGDGHIYQEKERLYTGIYTDNNLHFLRNCQVR